MSDKCQTNAVGDLSSLREAVCIHTRKICDACIDKDCIEDLRVFLTQDSQQVLEQATNVRARSAELLHVTIDVEPAQFNSGNYTIDITYFYRILADAIVCGTRPSTICGLAAFSKRVILCGGEGGAKIFSSRTVLDGFDQQKAMRSNLPEAVVEIIDPMVLATQVVDVCNCNCSDSVCLNLPDGICACFDGELVLSGESRRLLVTLGQFSIVRLERDTQLKIPAFGYCIPTKDCSATGGVSDESPCDTFGQIEFPVGTFFPPCADRGCGSTGSALSLSGSCGSVAGTTTTNTCTNNTTTTCRTCR